MRQRLKGCKDREKMTIDLERNTLDKISVSYVKRDGKRKHVQLYSDLTGKQTLLLSALLKVKPADVEKTFKEILVWKWECGLHKCATPDPIGQLLVSRDQK